MQNHSNIFRRDIQALRAFAVFVVIAFHLALPGFSNGFLGVDIFFVISGYLMEKLYRPNSGAIEFYTRRARRLLPPYFITLWLSTIAVIILLLPEAVNRVSAQLQASALFYSNFLHWSEESYFTNAQFSPLLHFWSLALELQFYVLFPFISNWTRTRRWLLPGIAIISLAICLFVLTASPKTSFFAMPLRLWEFCIGMIVARLRFTIENDRLLALALVAIIGLFFLFAIPVNGTATSIFYGHPGLVAIACSLTVAVIIFIGIPDKYIHSSIVNLGNVSYSLYLVHFPIIAIYFYRPFSGTNLGTGNLMDVVPLLLMMIPSTFALYFLVERKAEYLFRWRNVFLSIIVTLFLAAIMTPFAERIAPAFVVRLSKSLNDREEARCGKLYRFTNFNDSFCIYGSKKTPAIYLLGDSHSEMIAREVRNIAETYGYSVVMPKNRNDFFKPVDWHLQQMRRYGVTSVLVTWRDHETELSQISNLVKEISKDYPISVLLPQPELPAPAPLLTLRSWQGGKDIATIESMPYRERLRNISVYFEKIKNVSIFDPSILCTQYCSLNSPDGTAYFFDSNHLTLSGAARLNFIIRQAMQDIIERESM